MWADNAGARPPPGRVPGGRSLADAELRPVLPRITVPTLLIHGELDQRAPLAVARELHASIPEASLVVIPGAGHLCHLEAPDRFDAHVRTFVTTRDG